MVHWQLESPSLEADLDSLSRDKDMASAPNRRLSTNGGVLRVD